MVWTLRSLEAVLAANRLPKGSRTLLAGLPGLAERQAAVDELARHCRTVHSWAYAEAESRRMSLRIPLDQRTKTHETLLTEAKQTYADLGIAPSGTNLADLQAAWPEVSELLARIERDERLLGPDHQATDGGGLLPGDEPEDRRVHEARRLRTLLHDAEDAAASIAHARSDIADVDPYLIDEQEAEIEAEYRARGFTVRYPPDEGRPILDPGLIQQLGAVGIDLAAFAE